MRALDQTGRNHPINEGDLVVKIVLRQDSVHLEYAPSDGSRFITASYVVLVVAIISVFQPWLLTRLGLLDQTRPEILAAAIACSSNIFAALAGAVLLLANRKTRNLNVNRLGWASPNISPPS